MSELHDHLPLKPLDLSVLLVLAQGPEYGYGIVKRIAEAEVGAIRLAPSNLYYVLDRMMEAGLVEVAEDVKDERAGDDRRRYYRITPWGQRVARAEADRLTEVVRTAERLRLTGREA
jgi:DNA-binding PadR family transcriptional regulator